MKKTFAILTLAALALCPCLALGQTPLVNSSKMIADGIVTEPKLSVAVQAKLNAAYALIPTVQALGVSTKTISDALGVETAARIAADYAVGASTEALAIALLDEYNERVAADLAIGVDTAAVSAALAQETLDRKGADLAIGVDTAALNASKVAKAGDSMSGSLSFTVPATGVNWQDGSVSTTGNVAVDTSGLLEKTGGTMTGPLIVNSTLQASTVTVTEILKLVRSTPTTDAVKADEIFKVGTRETNGRPGMQFYPPCQGGQCGVFKLGLQASGEGDPFDRDSDGFVAMNPTKNRTTSLGTMGYDFSCMRVTQGDNFGAEYVRVCEDGISLSTGPNAEHRTVAFDTANGSGTFLGQLQASTFVAVGSAFIVGDNIMNADGLSIGAGAPITLDGATGDIVANTLAGDGSNLTALQPGNVTGGNFDATARTFDFDLGGAGLYLQPGDPTGNVSIVAEVASVALKVSSNIHMTGGVLQFADGTQMKTAASGGAVSYPLSAPDGSNAAPSYSFSGGSDSGMYRGSFPSSLGFAFGGTPKLILKATEAEFSQGVKTITTGDGVYGVESSTGIKVNAGGVTFADSTVQYSAPVMLFGGMYREDLIGPSCPVANPATGACTCPAGYTNVALLSDPGEETHYCYKP